MEKRIRGIFMKKRTGRGVRTAAAVLAGIMLVACFTTACQPTPEKINIVAKNGTLEDTIEKEPAEGIKYNFPQNFHDSYVLTDKLNVNVDADVSVPTVNAYPVYNIAFTPFSSEQSSSLIKILFGDATVYKKSGIRTKAVIEEEIVNYKKLASDITTGKQKGDLNYIQDTINKLEKEMANAPKEAAETPYDGSMDSNKEGTYLEVNGNVGKGRDATLEIRNDEDNRISRMLYQNGTEYFSDGGVNKQAKGLSQTYKGAIDLVSQWLHNAGMDDISPVICYVGSSYGSGDVKGKEGYVVNCERQIEGIPVTYNLNVNSSSSLNSKPDFSQQFNKEKLTFTIDDTGITTIKWENQYNTKVKSKNVQLLSFEDMTKHFTQGMKYKYSWVDDKSGVEGTTGSVTLAVTQIKLGLAVIPEKDKVGNFILVPAWYFFGTESSQSNGKTDVMAFNDRSLVTINAIDGSIID